MRSPPQFGREPSRALVKRHGLCGGQSAQAGVAKEGRDRTRSRAVKTGEKDRFLRPRGLFGAETDHPTAKHHRGARQDAAGAMGLLGGGTGQQQLIMGQDGGAQTEIKNLYFAPPHRIVPRRSCFNRTVGSTNLLARSHKSKIIKRVVTHTCTIARKEEACFRQIIRSYYK